jgi:D-sedoheptulose 7-phosphate isomerase
MNFTSFIDEYLEHLNRVLRALDKNELEKLERLLGSLGEDQRVYIIGNGGSAATASHMVNDFGVGLKRRGKLNITAVALADNLASCSAIANDTGYDNIFYLQLKNVLRAHDVLIAISCSGTSPNIIKAVRYAKEKGATVVGFSGFDGGELNTLSDIVLHAKTEPGEYGIVEDVHMVINHLLYSWFIQKGPVL